MRTASARAAVGLLLAACACSPRTPPPAARQEPARGLVLVTIDTMRADHVGAYGYAAARTPALDRIAREGVRFDRAFAPAPITLTSHASLLTGRYPPGHLARDNGMAMSASVPTLATVLHDRGFATAAFVAAYPLDGRFGLARGFDVYDDRMPRGPDGRLANERPSSVVVDAAIRWLTPIVGPASAGMVGQASRLADKPRPGFFLWVHLFEPHAPYGDPVRDGNRPAIDRYDDEIATADRETGRLLSALGAAAARTLVVVASDHGEAFGEHGETGHSLFVYDTTLRVALLARGPGVPAGRVVPDPVSLVDVAPTVLRLLGAAGLDADGIDLGPAVNGGRLAPRSLYAESFAPLVDFGWSPLRALRDGRWKAIAAPRPELFDVDADPGETRDLAPPPRASAAAVGGSSQPALPGLLARIDRFSSPDLPAAAKGPAPAGSGRLASLGYVQGGRSSAGRADPKDRREEAARIAAVTSGELQGATLLRTLEAIVEEDPGNGQMQLRLGDALLGAGRPADAAPHFSAAMAAKVPSADPYLGLAVCQARAGRTADAVATLRRSQAVERDNPVVLANLGLLLAEQRQTDAAVAAFEQALTIDADLHEARFNLALVFARAGRRVEAKSEVRTLLERLPRNAPQRTEVERLLAAVK